ncbi:MAG: phytase, partial [Bacteroidales bacterium]
MRNIILPMLLIFSMLWGCKTDQGNRQKSTIENYWNTLDSSGFSVYLGNAINEQKTINTFITADLETEPVHAPKGIDAADDPAIWINKENPEKSLILGTNKKAGLHVYDMNGKELQFLPVGCLNNVDLRDDFYFNNKNVVLVASSNCTLNTISLFYIDKNTLTVSDTILNIKSAINSVYGLCMYKSQKTGKFYVFVNGKGAEVEQWEILTHNNELDANLVHEFSVNSKPEGMVADDESGWLFIGVEEEGILKTNADPHSEFYTNWLAGSIPDQNKSVSSDIEGLALYKTTDRTYLVASSQGNFSFAIFELGETERYLFSFVIKDGKIDGAEETDGI